MTEPPHTEPTPKPAKSDPNVPSQPYPGTSPDDVGEGRGRPLAPAHEEPDPKGGTGPDRRKKK